MEEIESIIEEEDICSWNRILIFYGKSTIVIVMTDWVPATPVLRKTIAKNFKNISGLNRNNVKNIEPHAEENCILIKSMYLILILLARIRICGNQLLYVLHCDHAEKLHFGRGNVYFVDDFYSIILLCVPHFVSISQEKSL